LYFSPIRKTLHTTRSTRAKSVSSANCTKLRWWCIKQFRFSVGLLLVYTQILLGKILYIHSILE
jgi:hypothetical protein